MPMPKMNNVDHTGITVSDLDRSLAFYEDILECERLSVSSISGQGISRGVNVPNARLRFALLRTSNTIIELIEYEQPRGKPIERSNNDIGSAHIAFQVDDIWKKYEELRDKGIEFNAEPYTFSDADGNPAGSGTTFVYFKDPDGIQLEMYQLAPSE